MLTAPIHPLILAPGSRITLPHCTWENYQALQEWEAYCSDWGKSF